MMRRWLSSLKRDRTQSHVAPFVVFMGLLFLFSLIDDPFLGFAWKHVDAPWWRHYPEQWFYPLQALITFALLWYCRRQYEITWDLKKILLGVFAGLIGIGIWISPSIVYDGFTNKDHIPEWMELLGVVDRSEGFDPSVFESSVGYWSSLLLRLFRAVVVVSLIEEIFWRGFLMRFLLKPCLLYTSPSPRDA